MPIKIDKSGLDRLKKNIEDLGNTKTVTLGELMNPAFIAAHSKFSDLDSLFAASGFKIDNAEDFKAIPDEDWDAFISANTDFSDWKEMQHRAHSDWVKSKMGAGFS